MFVTKDSTW